MSVFTTNLGLENPPYKGDIDNWGTTENTARSMVDMAVGQVVFPLTGATFSIALTNGVPSRGLARVWIFTGTPGVPVTITFSPNTAQNFVFVVNQTNQPLTFTQGNGTNVTVIGLGSNVIYFDGGGAGANVAEFPTIPNQPPGSVADPSYSFNGFSDVGLFVPMPSALSVAANGAEMAQFHSKPGSTGPSGLNKLGEGISGLGTGPYIANAFANVNPFLPGWTGPLVPWGYYTFWANESNGLSYMYYLDSTGNLQYLLLGSYVGGNDNIPTFIGGAPLVPTPNQYSYFEINQPGNELDWWFRGPEGNLHGPIPIASYQNLGTGVPCAGPLATYVGQPPWTVSPRQQYFTVNEATGEVFWSYVNSAGQGQGPLPFMSYRTNTGPGPIATYVGATPTTVYNGSMFFVVNETTGRVNLYYHTSTGAGVGPLSVAAFDPSALTPANLGSFVGAAPVSPLPSRQYGYITVTENNSNINFNYLDSGGTLRTTVLANYSPAGNWQTYTPSFIGTHSSLISAQGSYSVVAPKTVAVQILIAINSNPGGPGINDAYTIGLPVPAGGPFAQNITGTSDNLGIVGTIYHAVLSGNTFTANAQLANANGTAYLSFNGVYQSA